MACSPTWPSSGKQNFWGPYNRTMNRWVSSLRKVTMESTALEMALCLLLRGYRPILSHPPNQRKFYHLNWENSTSELKCCNRKFSNWRGKTRLYICHKKFRREIRNQSEALRSKSQDQEVCSRRPTRMLKCSHTSKMWTICMLRATMSSIKYFWTTSNDRMLSRKWFW